MLPISYRNETKANKKKNHYLITCPFHPVTYLLQTFLLWYFIVMIHILKVIIFLTAESNRRVKKIEFKITLNNFFSNYLYPFSNCTYCSKMIYGICMNIRSASSSGLHSPCQRNRINFNFKAMYWDTDR